MKNLNEIIYKALLESKVLQEDLIKHPQLMLENKYFNRAIKANQIEIEKALALIEEKLD